VVRTLLAPWRQSQTWWSLTHVVLDLPIGVVTFTIVITLAATSVGLLIVFPLAIPVIWLTFISARVLAGLERTRFSALLGIELADPIGPLEGKTFWRRWVERLRTPARWREIGYLLLLLPLGVLTSGLTLLAWCVSAALLAMPLYVSALPGGTAKFWLFEVHPGIGAAGATLVGAVGLVLVAPWTTLAMAGVSAASGRKLLGRPERDEVDARVAAIETRRVAAVDSAEAERRRIERDLHDGTQARLVALAMDLGVARERLEHDPESKEGRELVAEAHEEVKATLKELRDLVRGIHPAILEDRGLDAALSAVVARSPIPVRLDVSLPTRPSPAVESTAYFVVSETLTNVARHARARSASVSIGQRGDRLVIEVRDDGIGGADQRRGTGLRGLDDRVAALGGWMKVVSPEGGPTTVFVEVPCAS
jgi:signal transduction histidine kinase